MTLAQFLVELNIRIGDTDNFTFTAEEKTSALTEAFNDEYVVNPIWDTTLTYHTTTYQYAIPAALTIVKDIYIRADNSVDNPEPIGSNFWKVVGSYIQFSPSSNVPDGYTLYTSGSYKYTVSDNITKVNLQEYILTLAQFRLYKTLLNKKSFRFLKNDTSVSEIVAIKRDLEQDVAKYRQRLPKEYQIA